MCIYINTEYWPKHSFKIENMIVKPEKFEAIIIDKKGQNSNTTEINIDSKKINPISSVLLLGFETDIKPNFDKYISKGRYTYVQFGLQFKL